MQAAKLVGLTSGVRLENNVTLRSPDPSQFPEMAPCQEQAQSASKLDITSSKSCVPVSAPATGVTV